MKKIMILGLLAIGLASCSEDTIDNIGRDTAQNIIRSNKWHDVVRTEWENGKEIDRDTIVGNKTNDRVEFDKDGFAYIYNGAGEAKSVSYEMPNSKTMIFDKVTYTINENIITTIVKFSMDNTVDGKTVRYEFKRR